MKDKVMKLLPKQCTEEMELFTGIYKDDNDKTISEFANAIYENDNYKHCTNHEDILDKYNCNRYKPRDGELVKAADQLAAFIEAFVAIENGCSSKELYEALNTSKLKSRIKEEKRAKEKKEEKEEKEEDKYFSKKIFETMDPIFSDF